MNAKIQDSLEKQLFAATALFGIDEAITMLQRERVKVAAALNGNRGALKRMTVVDFVNGLVAPVPTSPEPKPKRKAKSARRKAKVQAVETKPTRKAKKVEPPVKKPSSVKSIALEFGGEKMHDALKTVMAKGPQPIRKIATYLKRQKVTKDTTTATKKDIVAFIAADKTFSCKSRGVFQLRVRRAA